MTPNLHLGNIPSEAAVWTLASACSRVSKGTEHSARARGLAPRDFHKNGLGWMPRFTPGETLD